jgi:hypothetical protein
MALLFSAISVGDTLDFVLIYLGKYPGMHCAGIIDRKV